VPYIRSALVAYLQDAQAAQIVSHRTAENLIYRIVAVDGDAPPVTVTHCMTEAEAKTWIRQRLKDDVRAAMDRLMDAAKALR
jgi:hypothetical protein